jgi:hypothetical protein|nr:MAG TPA: hypothetical protein [Caudoviricetes sp.]
MIEKEYTDNTSKLPDDEYVSMYDQALAQLGERKIKIVGSLSETIAGLLNDVYHDRSEAIAKRTSFTTESEDTVGIDVPDEDIARRIVSDILEKDQDATIHVVKDEEVSLDTFDHLKEDAIMNGENLYLITIDSDSKNDLPLNQEGIRVTMEDYVLKYKGHVYRGHIRTRDGSDDE